MTKKVPMDKIYIIAVVLIVVTLIGLFLFTGESFQLIKSLFSSDMTEEQLRETTQQLGWNGYLTLILLSMVQVMCPFLPSQPIMVLAGIAYGFPIGFLCCFVGFFLGSTAIFLLFKRYGNGLRRFFMKDVDLDLDSLAHSGKISVIIGLLFLIPALPYAMICFFAASIGFSFRRYTLVNTLGVVPSILAGVALGNMTMTSDPITTILVFAALLAFMGLLLYKRKWIFTKLGNFAANSNP